MIDVIYAGNSGVDAADDDVATAAAVDGVVAGEAVEGLTRARASERVVAGSAVTPGDPSRAQ